MVKTQNQLSRLEKQRAQLIEYLLSDCPLIRGSYTEVLVKCGRTGCHCEKKPAHLVSRLIIHQNGHPQCKLIRVADRDSVQTLVQNYKQHKQAWRQLVQIHNKQEALVKTLIGEKDVGYR